MTVAKQVVTEGPFGIPMQDRQAIQLDSILKALPAEDRALKRAVKPAATAETLAGERADVSWISTEEVDRDREIVVSRGLNDAHFRLNPIVTLQHSCHSCPVGRSLWRKRVKDGATAGIKAKTVYASRPEEVAGGRSLEAGLCFYARPEPDCSTVSPSAL